MTAHTSDIDDLLSEFNMVEREDGSLDTGIQFLKLSTFRVVVHVDVLTKMEQLYEQYPRYEYGLYLKGFFDPSQNIFYVGVESPDDIYIPRQSVSSSYIEFLEGRPSVEFNTAIHRHPEGAFAFSSVDAKSINSNFECSLLYAKSRGIFKANINVYTDMQGVAFTFETDSVEIFRPEMPDIENIRSKILIGRQAGQRTSESKGIITRNAPKDSKLDLSKVRTKINAVKSSPSDLINNK